VAHKNKKKKKKVHLENVPYGELGRHWKRCKRRFHKTEIVITVFSDKKPSFNYIPGKELISAVKGLYGHTGEGLDAYVSLDYESISCKRMCIVGEDLGRAAASEDILSLTTALAEEVKPNG